MPSLWCLGIILIGHVITVNYARINPDKDNCLNYESDYHVHRACKCVVYQSEGGTEGRFHTPNFPQYYSKGIDCILFTFIGDLGELVEIKFTEFDMMHPDRNGCRDYLKLFLYLDRPEVNENNKYDVTLCGNMSNLQQKTFYSKDRSLIMEFQTTVPSRQELPFYPGYRGFRGLFRFLDARQFKSDGLKQPGTMCSWDFSSSTMAGKFFSPTYPQNYPPLSKCQYTFYGQSHDGTVKVQFQNIQIYNEGLNCRDSPDRIAIYDGMNSSAPLIKYLCGVKNQEEVISTTPYLYIEFHSDEFHQSQGFAANYTFQHKALSSPSTFNPAFNCNQYISSSNQKEGIIRSQNYPSPYPSSTKCTYILNGTANERVQIKFRRVDLFYDGGNPEDPFECDGQDSLKIYIKIDGVEKELAVTCGQKIPQMYMSNIPWMKVVFESGSRTHANLGFEMEYRFLTNYGIETGQQDDRKVCKFYYKSAVKMSGYFVSPNFPGFYPKNTECQYTFYGSNHEVVKIVFHVFDVDGIPPRCEPKDQVDYVDFSNFDGAQDMKMDKFCGLMTEKIARPLKSDLAFFRVTFKSNSMYEGIGFNATYQFIMNEETTKKPDNSPLTGHSNSIQKSSYLVFYLLTLVTFQLSTVWSS